MVKGETGRLNPSGLHIIFRGMKSLVLHEQAFVTDAQGKRVAVMLDLKTYHRLCEAEEELTEVHAYDTANPKVAADVRAGRITSLAEYAAKRSRRKARK
jgi:hypothetical protein